jgi:putative Mg2+ transporter-C (MgtC) family protein
MNELLDAVRDELSAGIPDARTVARTLIRISLAIFLAGIIGWEREREQKAAGLRTHILVALGAAIFALAAQESGASANDMTRVAQGVATGIGFMGGGVILQLVKERRIKGLTTAAGIWLTAAIGLAAGMGRTATAVLGTLACWLVLSVFSRIERNIQKKNASNSAGSGVGNTPQKSGE